jgi:hypothetical protein
MGTNSPQEGQVTWWPVVEPGRKKVQPQAQVRFNLAMVVFPNEECRDPKFYFNSPLARCDYCSDLEFRVSGRRDRRVIRQDVEGLGSGKGGSGSTESTGIDVLQARQRGQRPAA